MKKHLLLFSSLVFSLNAYCQFYNTAGGLRMGTDWGITVKQRFAKRSTLEGIFQNSFRRDEFIITALAEQHFPLLSKGFNIYLGGGLHKGWLTDEELVARDPFGITVVGGAEITLGRFNISWDIKPAFNLSGGDQDIYFQSGFSLRYVFWKRESSFNRWFREGKWKFWKKDKS